MAAPQEALTNLHSRFPAKVPATKTVAAAPAVVPVLPFGTYYRANFTATPQGAFDNLYSRFGVNKPTAAAKAAPAFADAPPGFALLPSVGTWLAPKAPVIKTPPPPPPEPFQLQPSVGTWLIHRRAEPGPKQQAKETVAMWCHKPSIGTW